MYKMNFEELIKHHQKHHEREEELKEVITELLNACEATMEMYETALPQFDWGKSPLQANGIRLLNETPITIRAAMTRAKKSL